MKKIIKSFEKIYNIKLYDFQKKALNELQKGNLTEIPTGSGKSLISLIFVIKKILEGRKVIFSFPNSSLAKRDYEFAVPLLEHFNISHRLLDCACKGNNYDIDIVYGSSEIFVFDYLNDIPQHFDFAFLDEMDFTLIECASSSMSVGNTYSYLPDKNFIQFGIDFFLSLKGKEIQEKNLGEASLEYFDCDYVYSLYDSSYMFTTNGYDKILQIPNLQKQIEYTLEALLFHKKDVDFSVKDDRIVLINKYNGRITKNSKFKSSIQSVLEVYYKVPLTEYSELGISMSYPVYFSKFKNISGVSATLKSYEDSFNLLFGLNVIKIKGLNGIIKTEKEQFFINNKIRNNKVIDKVLENPDIPFLIIAHDDISAKEFANECSLREIEYSLLINNNLNDEIDIIKEAGTQGKITISTPILGRGTDIKDYSEGRLYIILLGHGLVEAVDIQIKGRTARNKLNGNFCVYNSLDDIIFKGLDKHKLYLNTLTPKKLISIIKKQQKINSSITLSTLLENYKFEKILDVHSQKLKHQMGYYNEDVLITEINKIVFEILWCNLIYNLSFDYYHSFEQDKFKSLVSTLQESEREFKGEFDRLVNVFLSDYNRVERKI